MGPASSTSSVGNGPAVADRFGVVAVVLRARRLLVIRRSLTVAAPGAYCFPGGGILPGESEPVALVRELREELGVAAQPVARIWENVTANRVALGWWLTELCDDDQLVANPAEVQSIHWFSVDELRFLPGLLESNVQFLDALARGQIELLGERGAGTRN